MAKPQATLAGSQGGSNRRQPGVLCVEQRCVGEWPCQNGGGPHLHNGHSDCTFVETEKNWNSRCFNHQNICAHGTTNGIISYISYDYNWIIYIQYILVHGDWDCNRISPKMGCPKVHEPHLRQIPIFRQTHWFVSTSKLFGGLEHLLFFHILGIIIPTDFHIFQRGGSTTKQLKVDVFNHVPMVVSLEGHLPRRWTFAAALRA